jgi:hypothetical protein
MSDETENQEPSAVRPVTESEAVPSSVFHISLRGWLAIMLVGTVCYMSIVGKAVEEPLYSLSIAALGFYFGQIKPRGQP